MQQKTKLLTITFLTILASTAGIPSLSTGTKDIQASETWLIRSASSQNGDFIFQMTSCCNFLHLYYQFVKREDVILNVGCGNSRMTEEMFEDGQYITILPLKPFFATSSGMINFPSQVTHQLQMWISRALSLTK